MGGAWAVTHDSSTTLASSYPAEDLLSCEGGRLSPDRPPGCPVRPLLGAWEACMQIKVQSEQAVNLSVFPGGVLTAPGNSETEPVCPLFPTERMVAHDQRKLWFGQLPCLRTWVVSGMNLGHCLTEPYPSSFVTSSTFGGKNSSFPDESIASCCSCKQRSCMA